MKSIKTRGDNTDNREYFSLKKFWTATKENMSKMIDDLEENIWQFSGKRWLKQTKNKQTKGCNSKTSDPKPIVENFRNVIDIFCIDKKNYFIL